MTRLLLPVVLILCALATQKVFALDGLVTNVHDGDSLTVTGQAKNIRVRYIDAPELKAFKWDYQPYAAEARTALLNLCSGKVATLTNITQDKYNRLDANVNCQGYDVAKWQIDNGFAWNYKYAPKRFRVLALNAKAKKIGLWALPNPINPIDWRKGVTK